MTNFTIRSVSAFARRAIFGGLIIGAAAMQTGYQDPSQAGAYQIAKRYMGLHEAKHTGKLSKYLGVNPRRTPWCGAFAGTVMKKAGKSVPNGYMRAASWKRSGKAVSLNRARRGDIVVVRTKRGNHVGFYAGKKDGKVLLLGGNQSNQVKISAYRASSVQAVRRH